MGQKKKKKKWIKSRHKIVRNIAYHIVAPYTRWKYGVTIEPFKEQGDRQYLVLMNHQTAFDQFFMGMAIKGPVYYIASEDIFSNGLVSKLIRYLVAPIPIKKQATDVQAVFNSARVVKEGGTIGLFPEGNRTFSGKTEYIKPSVVKLVKALRLPIAIMKVEGGYGVHPRWSDAVRKGSMRVYVSCVIEPEDYKNLSDEELFEKITRELYVDESKIQDFYYHKKSAEYLERAMYVCPDCGLSEFESKDDTITCLKCRKQIKYRPDKELVGCGFTFPFRYVGDWYDYQSEFIHGLDLSPYQETFMYQDKVSLYEVILYKNKKRILKEALLSLYGNRMLIEAEGREPLVLDFDTVSVVAVLGRNKLNIYYGDKVYQIKSNKHFNALKYVNIYYHYRNTKEEFKNGKFLGL